MSLPPAEIGPGEFYPVVGVGPHPKPWPVGEHFDPELLENGDRRNVLDKYRYWKVEAIVADLNTKRHPLRVAIENGAMVTDKYLTVIHHPTVADFKAWCDENKVAIIGIDNVDISTPIESAKFPRDCVLFLGQEGAGMSDEAVAACQQVLAISQYGSTRSMNASAAGAIAMYAWAMQHLPK